MDEEERCSLLSSYRDLRHPEELYPRARLRRRKFVYHGGPTNSGKTYRALEALKRADPERGGGVYAGPLRLLAVEVYERLNRSGVYCSLFTGQERREVPFASHASCTIEMVPVGSSFDVAVVDEIQLIGSLDRGHAWTRAVHGLDAREVHLCGACEAAELLQRMCQASGDDFELVEYSRLTPLVVEDKPLESWRDVRRGDCVVTFSRDDIHQVRREIETSNPGVKCCVVYGQLPPETRSEQARLFNQGKYDVIVASDAIGMGLNLNIGRVVFRSTNKYSSPSRPPEGTSRFLLPSLVQNTEKDEPAEPSSPSFGIEKRIAPVEPTLVKQIAGRAGRASSNFATGAVTAMTVDDLAYVRAALAAPPPPISRAGLFPPAELLTVYSAALDPDGQMSLADVAGDFAARCTLDPTTYFLCPHHDVASVAQKLESVTALNVADKLAFCNAPCNVNDRFAFSMLEKYAKARATRPPTTASPNVRLPTKPPSKLLDLHELCSKHNVLGIYLWLALRFPQTFPDAELARAQKLKCIRLITKALAVGNLQLPPAKNAADQALCERKQVQPRTRLPVSARSNKSLRPASKLLAASKRRDVTQNYLSAHRRGATQSSANHASSKPAAAPSRHIARRKRRKKLATAIRSAAGRT